LIEEIVGEIFMQQSPRVEMFNDKLRKLCVIAVQLYAKECSRSLANVVAEDEDDHDNRREIWQFIESLALLNGSKYAKIVLRELLESVEHSLLTADLNLFANLMEPVCQVHKLSLLTNDDDNCNIGQLLDRILVDIAPHIDDSDAFIIHQLGAVIYPLGVLQ
jgi:hypothetical protein